MLDIERDLLAEMYYQFDKVYANGQPVFGQMYVSTKVPWLAERKSDAKGKQKSMVSSMVDLYKRHKNAQEKRKEE